MRLRRVTSSDPGLRRSRQGRGFSYRDADGRVVSADDRARIEALAIPPAWTDVWICAIPNGHLQATGVDEAGRRQYLYHEAWQRRAATLKFTRMLEFAAALPAARRSATRDLRAGESDRAVALAVAFKLLDRGMLRVGSELYEQEHGSIGLSTLRISHVRVSAGSIALKFPGKSGMAWSSEIKDAELAKAVAGLATRGKRARLLGWQDGRSWRALQPAEINDDLRDRTHLDVSAKDFRTLHGTATAAVALAKADPATTKTAKQRVIRDAIRATADALGNTPAVARSSYIDPRVFERYEAGQTIDVRRAVEPQLVTLLSGRPAA